MARGQSAGAVRVDVLAQTSRYTRSMSDARKRLIRFRRVAVDAGKKIKSAFKAVTVGLGALTAAIVYGTKKMVDYSSRLLETSRAAGLTTRAMRDIRALLAGDGLSVERSTKAMLEFNRRLGEAHQGFGTANRAIKALGVSLRDQNGNLRSNEDLFFDVANRLRSMTNESKAASIAYDLLGRDGKEIVATFRNVDGSLRGAASELGKYRTLSYEQLEANKELGQAQTNFNESLKDMWNRILAPMAPTLTRVLEDWTDWLQELKDSPQFMERVKVTMEDIASAIESISKGIRSAVEGAASASKWLDTQTGEIKVLAKLVTGQGLDIPTTKEGFLSLSEPEQNAAFNTVKDNVEASMRRYNNAENFYIANSRSDIHFSETRGGIKFQKDLNEARKLFAVINDLIAESQGWLTFKPTPTPTAPSQGGSEVEPARRKPTALEMLLDRAGIPSRPSVGYDYNFVASMLDPTGGPNFGHNILARRLNQSMAAPSYAIGGQDYARRLLASRTGTGATVPFPTPLEPTRGYSRTDVLGILDRMSPSTPTFNDGLLSDNLMKEYGPIVAEKITPVMMDYAANLLEGLWDVGPTSYGSGVSEEINKQFGEIIPSKLLPPMAEWAAGELEERLKVATPLTSGDGGSWMRKQLEDMTTNVTPLMLEWASSALEKRMRIIEPSSMIPSGSVAMPTMITPAMQEWANSRLPQNQGRMYGGSTDWQDMSNQFKEIAEAQKKVADGNNQLRASFDQMGISIFENFRNAGDALKSFARQLLNIGFQRTILNPIGGALFGAADGSTSGLLGGFFNSIFPAGARADGGLARGGLGLVGERGPEVVDFSQPGRVYTTEQLGAALSGGKGVNITYNISSTDGPGVRAALAQATPGIVNAAQAQITDNASRYGSTRRMIRGKA